MANEQTLQEGQELQEVLKAVQVLYRFQAAARGISPLVNVEDNLMTCPRCKLAAPINDYKTLGLIQEYAAFLAVVVKCPACTHLFAPLR